MTTDAGGGLIQHLLRNLVRLASLSAIAGVDGEPAERGNAGGVHDRDNRGPVRIEESGQCGGGVVEATHLHEEMPPRDLADVQKDRESAFERFGDESVGLLECVVGAVERNECGRAPEPRQQLIESVWLCKLVAEDSVEQFERMVEVPGDAPKTRLAE